MEPCFPVCQPDELLVLIVLSSTVKAGRCPGPSSSRRSRGNRMASSAVSKGRPVSWVKLLWLLEPCPSRSSRVEREVLAPSAPDSHCAVSRSTGAETWISPALARKVASDGP